jgi:hypothetical protein
MQGAVSVMLDGSAVSGSLTGYVKGSLSLDMKVKATGKTPRCKAKWVRANGRPIIKRYMEGGKRAGSGKGSIEVSIKFQDMKTGSDGIDVQTPVTLAMYIRSYNLADW